MPQVPEYGNLRAGGNTLGAATLEQPRMSPQAVEAGQTVAAGEALRGAGREVMSIAADMTAQANQVRVNDAMNRAMAARLRLTHDPQAGYTTLQGDAALTRPDGKPLDEEYGQRLRDDLDGIAGSLGNDAQKRAFSMQADQLLTSFRGEVQAHMAKEFRQYSVNTQDGTVKVATDQMALDWAKPDAVAQGRNAIKAAVAEAGRLQGWAPAYTVARQVEALSTAHVGVIGNALQSGNVDYAKAYMQQVGAELTPQARLQLGEQLKAGDVALQASRKADEIWTTAGPGADRNAPVDLFAMERAAREAFATDPAKAKATITELRERAAAFNSSQAEYHAANTTAVYKMLDSGQGINKVRASAAWQALPGDQQHRIMLSLEQEAAARESRAAAAEGRALTRMQREQSMLLLQNGEAYLRYGDPTVLAGMTRTAVEALRPVFGLDGTQHLLQKWDTLQSKEGRFEAKVDADDFNNFADQLGLRPFDKDSTEDHKRQLGELRFRIEQLIDRAQATKKQPLDRQEKRSLMQQEMARKVAVPTWFGMGSEQVPVIQLTPDQAAKVTVPQQDRAQIVEALKTMYDRTGAAQYAPTEDNVRRRYLQRRSPAAGLIPPPK